MAGQTTDGKRGSPLREVLCDRGTLRRALWLFTPLVLLFALVTGVLHYVNVRGEEALVRARVEHNLALVRRLVAAELDGVASDLMYLANLQDAKDVYAGMLKGAHALDLVEFMRRKKIYDQIRYLDVTGMERFRVNYNKGRPAIVPPSELQFKGRRDYFVKGSTLTAGDIYISAFDLNVEHGRVESPIKPVIRFSAPIFDEAGNRRGVVILNFLGRELLRLVEEIGNASDTGMMLVNAEGYWLQGPHPRDEWGFMFPGKQDRTFGKRYPEVWRRVRDMDEGQVLTPGGLFAVSRLCLADMAGKKEGVRGVEAAECWKLVAHVAPEALTAGASGQLRKLLLFNVPLVLLAGVGALAVAVQCRRRTLAEQRVLALNEARGRFVPQKILDLIGKRSLLDVGLSDSVEKELTILFSDIRSYTALSEGLEAEQVLAFLNAYFAHINVALVANNGIVDKFIGDAVMALFPDSADDALRAALGMKQGLAEFNEEWAEGGRMPVRAGYGLHFGGVTVGTMGTPDRMQTTVIGDNVNLASRIESVTKAFGVDIVLSDKVRDELADPEAYDLRHIDTVRVKGKQEPVALYEAYGADEPALREGKKATAAEFTEAMEHYRTGDFETAMALFTRCQEACPEDTIPPIYIKRCNTMLRIPPGDGWTGVSTL